MAEAPAPELVDGSAPATPDELFARLDELGVEFTTTTHPPVFTVEEAKEVRGSIPGCHTKNLFLRDKKGRMWLLVCHQDREVDLRALADEIGASGRLSFGSEPRLMRYLGVEPGSVNPFAVINDVEGEVDVVLDREMLEWDVLNFHPLENFRTTSISRDDFLRFLVAEGHPPVVVDLAGL